MKYVNLDCPNPNCWVGLVPKRTPRGMRYTFCPTCKGNAVVLTAIHEEEREITLSASEVIRIAELHRRNQ